MTPKISVIIPVYNVSEYLDKCLWSVTNQTFRDIEIIIVNDGSTDDSLSVIERYAARDNRIKVINKQNGGVVLARKSGLDISLGDYVHYLDGDDYIELTTYELLYNRAIKENSDIVFMNFWFTKPNNKVIDEVHAYRKQQYNNLEFIEEILEEGIHASACLHIHKKTLYDNNIIYIPNIKIGEDTYLTTQLVYYSKIITVVNIPLYNYVYRNTSAIHGELSEAKVDSMFKSIEYIADFLKSKGLDKQFQRLLCKRWLVLNDSLLWNRYFKNSKERGKIYLDYINRYPEFIGITAPMHKLMKYYSKSKILGNLLVKCYTIKGKIK